jgi:hypothetical protein
MLKWPIVLRGAHRAHYAAVQVIGEQAHRRLLQRRITDATRTTT